MKIELAQHGTRQWWKEGGNATWGLGVQLDWFGTHDYGEHEGDERMVSEGWCLSFMLGGWSLNIYSEAGHRAIFGKESSLYRWFEIQRA